MSPPPKVLHFVTGGFSGATQVALDLVRAAQASGRSEPLLVLRKKRQTDPQRIAALQQQGLPIELVPGWSHAATIWRLQQLCRRFRPDVLVAHGFPEHLLGRWAGLLAGVPHLVHVEHNSRERYSRWRLLQARWLARRSDAIVGCSEGVRHSLLALGMPADKTLAISNGIRLEPFADAERHPYARRVPGLVMAARFAGQKDHATLLQALALLREQGLRPPLLLAGGGGERHLRAARALTQSLGLQQQVQFLGFQAGLPELLMQHQIAVLSTHYEGMPLSLVEGMAAGCAVVGTAVPGVQELLRDGDTGRLVPHRDARALADVLAELLREPQAAAALAERGRHAALAEHSLAGMTNQYEDLFNRLAREQ
ncbi:glycosyltransferase [Roseateles cavernae]|uniref:glycosyltransferase n=1 Tax=Roseateles cavernae TaxID=3153578 RepID=UPI0032E3F3A1